MLKIVSGNKIVLGITEENVARLRLGQPILIKGEDIGLESDKEIYITHGNTDVDLMNALGVTPDMITSH